LSQKLIEKILRKLYWSEDDGAFIVEVPELPGCMADGATYKEALDNAETVIAEWIETAKSLGREIPAPKGKLSLRMRFLYIREAYMKDRMDRIQGLADGG